MGPRAWPVLALVCSMQFLVVLDITVVNVALPAIDADLGLGPGLAWVVSAYAVTAAGAQLAAGRLADLRGARGVLLAGVAIFGACSLVAGLAPSGPVLVAARAAQGVGAALVSPAALAVLTAAVPSGRARARALGVWGSVGGLAACSGVLGGGLLAEAASWRAVFLINVPVAVLALAAGPRLLPRRPAGPRRRLDLPGAAMATGGLMLVVAGVGGQTLLLAPGALVLAGFAAWESRASDPLVPRAVLRSPALAWATAGGFLHAGMMLGTFLLLTLQMQQVMGASAAAVGLALLVVRGTQVVWAPLCARATGTAGVRPMLAAGMAGMTLALCALALLAHTASSPGDLIGPLLLLGAAIPALFLTVNLTALEGAGPGEAGTASGLLSTGQWAGGAVGVTLASSVAGAVPTASGMAAGYWACAALGAAGLAVAAALLRVPRPAEA